MGRISPHKLTSPNYIFYEDFMTSNSTPPTKRRRRWLRWLLGIPLLFICVVASAFAFLPVPEDAPISLEAQGGGARQDESATTGLQASWPELPTVDEGQAALGKQLFYDPILSAND